MRAGDPITSTIKAMRTVLRNINPAYEWSPDTGTGNYFVLPEQDCSLPEATGKADIQRLSSGGFNFSSNFHLNPKPHM